jgi:hypothetical protein
MNKSIAFALATVGFSFLAACGGSPGSVDESTAPSPTPAPAVEAPAEADATPPTIVSTTPATGATGQRSDVTVSITFSEAMDHGSVEQSLDTSELGSVNVVWSDDGRTVRIVPAAPLAYAAGFDVKPEEVAAKHYAVKLGTGPKDLAGNALAAGTQIAFDTLKEIGLVLHPSADLTRSITPSAALFTTSDPLVVGDDASNLGIRAGVTFDLAAVPSSAVDVSKAVLATRQLVGDTWGTPYADLGTSITLDHVTFASLDTQNAINAAFNTSQIALASQSGFCVEGQIAIESDVSKSVADDLSNRGQRADRAQFLLYFGGLTDQDGKIDRAVLSRDLMELQVSYLTP